MARPGQEGRQARVRLPVTGLPPFPQELALRVMLEALTTVPQGSPGVLLDGFPRQLHLARS